MQGVSLQKMYQHDKGNNSYETMSHWQKKK
jgi:hypothetical protein